MSALIAALVVGAYLGVGGYFAALLTPLGLTRREAVILLLFWPAVVWFMTRSDIRRGVRHGNSRS